MPTCPHGLGRLETAIVTSQNILGRWEGGQLSSTGNPADMSALLGSLREPLFVVERSGATLVGKGGHLSGGTEAADGLAVRAVVPPVHPAHLGDDTFLRDHGLTLPYVAGAMANGIASCEMVEAMGQAGMLGFFGAAGLMPEVVEDAIDRISAKLGDKPYGFNLIHSPYEPELEDAIVDLYLRRGVHTVSASAYLDLTLPVVRYRVSGIHQDASGRVVTPNQVVAKVSRIEVARKFFAPPPTEMLEELVRRGDITADQAEMARTIPVAQDITAEADSGGHTDNRPALALFPTIAALRDRMQREHGYDRPLRVGAAGGISTPHSAAAAFAMGAAYVLTGSVNQACREAGTSDTVREMLAQVEQADMRMAPAADMFEMGVKLQVLTRGSMFAMRAQKLHDVYTSCASLDAIPAAQRASLEKTIFRAPLDQIWLETREFWAHRDSNQVTRAEKDPKHQMALVFRWYLGQSSRWANAGVSSRKVDYQVWCGPAMGAFNEWVRGTWLESWEDRRVVSIAHNILRGAAVLTRASALRHQGVSVDSNCLDLTPRQPAELEEFLS